MQVKNCTRLVYSYGSLDNVFTMSQHLTATMMCQRARQDLDRATIEWLNYRSLCSGWSGTQGPPGWPQSNPAGEKGPSRVLGVMQPIKREPHRQRQEQHKLSVAQRPATWQATQHADSCHACEHVRVQNRDCRRESPARGTETWA